MINHSLFEVCLPSIIKQYRNETLKCDAKLPTFKWDKVPAGYVLFYIPETVNSIFVNDGINTIEYNSIEAIPGYSLDKTKLNISKNGIETIVTYYVLWSLTYQGIYDISMYYLDNEQMIYVDQENRYLSEWINPFWSANLISEKLLSKSVTIVSDKLYHVNNGSPLPNTIEYPELWNGIESILPEMHCNFGVKQIYDNDIETNESHLESISFNLNKIKLISGSEEFVNIRRRPSIQLSIAKNIRPHLTYCIMKFDAKFKIYFDDKLINESESALVFAPVKTGVYKINVFNEWYDKTFEIKI
jgi:hypothetical protein